MTCKFLIAGLLIAISGCKTGTTKARYLGKKIETVSPDYGVLPESYRARSGMRPLMWKCFPVKDVKIKYRTWRDADPMGPHDVIVTMCDFEMSVESHSVSHVYHGRRGKQIIYCDEFKAAWSKLTQGEEHICMDGETLTKGEPEKDEDTKQMFVSWTWDKIKTKKGCYSFWDAYNCVDF